jgi:ketol-acid reductoisomerase
VAEPYGDEDADLALVQDRNVAILGYDDQAAAQALCLRDSGVDVRVGLDSRSPLWDEAVGAGLRVVTTYEACEEADLVVLTATVPGDSSRIEALVANLVAGDVVVLGPVAALDREPPDGVDIVRIVPWAAGAVVRDEYNQGRGVPLFASVLQDASGAAWAVALAYARAIGGTRAGVIRTTDDEYATARSFAEVTLLEGGVLPLVRAGFDSLVEKGCQPEVAYLQCVYGLRLFATALARGDHDADLVADRAAGTRAADPDPLLTAGARVRSLMGWERAAEAGLD